MAENAHVRLSPELPNLAERFVSLTHLPYAWGCFFWAVIFAVVLPVVGGYLDTFDLEVAVNTFLNPNLQPWQGIAILALNLIDYGFLPFFFVRLMR